MLPRIVTRVVDCVRANWQFGVEFATHGSSTWVYKRTWKSGEFVRVAAAIIDRYYGDPSSELKILDKILCAIGSAASLISLSGGSHTRVDCSKDITGAATRRFLWTSPFSMFGFSNGVFKTLHWWFSLKN